MNSKTVFTLGIISFVTGDALEIRSLQEMPQTFVETPQHKIENSPIHSALLYGHETGDLTL